MKYLITGGSGFLGKALIKRLKGNDIIVVSRNESKLVEVKEKYGVEIVVGDISDPCIFDRIGQVDGIFHLAALKHIGIAEEYTKECVKTNIQGTLNLLEATRKFKPGFVITTSTDKAAQVSGVYGATKLLVEKLFVEYQKINPATNFRVVRYGNVLYSSGSVLEKWKEKILKGEDISVTDPESTRFYWTADQAIDLIFKCLKESTDATPMIADMKAIKTKDLAEAMIKKYLPEGKSIQINIIGLQPGENKHEELGSGRLNSLEADKYTKEEIYELI